MNPRKVKYGSKEYNEAYKNNQIVNSYNNGTYETSLPDLVVTPKNNINLGSVVRTGTSKVSEPIIKSATTILDFTPLSPAVAAGRIGSAIGTYKRTGDSRQMKRDISSAAFEALPYINMKALKIPLAETDDIIKTVSKEKFGIDKISLSTPRKGVIADIELSPSGYNDFGKKWMHPEFISVSKSEQGKGLSNVLYTEGIQHAKSKGYNGILSGEVLLQPEKTIKTQKRFNGPEMKNPVEEYDYPIKGMESPKDPNLSNKIIAEYNKNNMYKSTVGSELLTMVQSLFKDLKPAVQ